MSIKSSEFSPLEQPHGRNSSGANSSQNEKMGSWLSWLKTELFTILITAVISIAATYLLTFYSGRLRYLQFSLNASPGLIRTPEIPGKRIAITVDGRPVENISAITLAVFNTTDQDYDDVPMMVRFIKSTTKEPKIIQTIYRVPQDTFGMTQDTEELDGLHLGYNLKILNRSERAVFQADYIFEGNEIPSVEVRILKKGLALTLVDFPQPAHSSNVVVGIVFSFLSGMVVYAGYRLLRNRRNLQILTEAL